MLVIDWGTNSINDDLHVSAVSRQVDQYNFKIFMPSVYFKADVVVSL
jgi:hypothetical protein